MDAAGFVLMSAIVLGTTKIKKLVEFTGTAETSSRDVSRRFWKTFSQPRPAC